MVTEESFPVTASDSQTALPTGFLEMINLTVPYSGGSQQVTPVSRTQMNRLYPTSVGNTPTNYSIVGMNIEIKPPPAVDTDFNITYYKRFDALSADSDTNLLLTNEPNIYIYAVMIEATPFIQGDERMPLWNEMYTIERDRLNDEARDREFAGGPLQQIPLQTETP